MPIPVPSSAPATDLVTVSDVADHLNWSATETTKRQDEMAGFISAVTPIIEGIVGPVVPRQVDEWRDGGGPTIVLSQTPVLSVTSVTESFGSTTVWTLSNQTLDSGSLDAYGYTVDLQTGTLVRRVSGIAGRFAAGMRNVHITYQAGYSTTPPNIRLAALELIRVNWQPQQGGNRPGYTSASGVDEMQVDGSWRMGYFVPNRVMELLQPSRNSFGIA